MNTEQMRIEFEDWWKQFRSEHEEWKWADGEALLFQAWQAALSAKSVPEGLHPDTNKLVHDFSFALAEKLFQAEQKYGYSNGWKDNGWLDECRQKLIEHTAKGDPRDVAAYCAFLWYHGSHTAAPQPPQSIESDKVRELEKDAARYRYLRDKCSSADEGGLGMIATELQFTSLIDHSLVGKWPDALDKSIDQAIEAMKGDPG